MIDTAGKITIPFPGTPIQATANLADPSKHVSIHGVMFQALPTNSGKVYVGKIGLDKTTYENCFAILAVPTSNFIPTFSVALTIAPNGLALEPFYLDADVQDDGVLITVLVT